MDSTVVFNEVMFHPAGDNDALEWIELHNQMAADIDLSGWRINGGVQYEFAAGTILRGGSYLVVAADAVALQTASGYVGAKGPFTGRLANEGETLSLFSNNDRLMDELDYRDNDPWPVEPDGSGASLAKRDPDSGSAQPENWTSSAEVGGTPGRENFAVPTPSPSALLGFYPFDGNYLDAGPAHRNGTVFGSVPFDVGFDGQAISFANNPGNFVRVAVDSTRQSHASLTWGAWVKSTNPAGDLNTFISNDNGGWDRFTFTQGGKWSVSNGGGITSSTVNVTTAWTFVAVTFNGNTQQLYVDSDVPVLSASAPQGPSFNYTEIGRNADGNGTCGWQGLIDNVFIFGEALTSAQIHDIRLGGASAIVGLTIRAPERIWDFESGTLAGWSSATSPVGDNLVFTTAGNQPTSSPFVGYDGATVQGSYFIRTWEGEVLGLGDEHTGILQSEEFVLAPGAEFQFLVGGGGASGAGLADPFSGDPDSPAANMAAFNLERKVSVNDWQMIFTASGSNQNFLSSRSWDASAYAGQTVRLRMYDTAVGGWGHIDVDNIRYFNSTYVSPAPPTPLVIPKLAFNELSSLADPVFRVELVNYGTAAIPLGGLVLSGVGTSTIDYALPAQSLAAGARLVLDETQLGYRPTSGNRLFLYTAGKTGVIDGALVRAQLRGRYPEATGIWLYPDQPTFGAANSFAFHSEIVINEIMAHAYPTRAAGLPFAESTEEWIELYNRSATSVNLTGWSLAEGIDFQFPDDTVLGAGQYLVVAKDAASLLAQYPGRNVSATSREVLPTAESSFGW